MQVKILCLLIFVGLGKIHACPSGSVAGLKSNVCYYFVKNPLTWLAAERDCTRKGGNLVTIDSSFVNAYLKGLAQAEGLDEFWNGGTNMLTTGSWAWMDGSTFSFKNWASGYPQNLQSSCIVTSSNDGYWKNAACTGTNYYVCQVNSTAPTIKYCPDGWRYSSITQKCYIFKKEQVSSVDAQSRCRDLNSSLISIHTYPENSVVAGLADEYIPSLPFWIGLKCVGSEVSCSWSDGSKYDYKQWATNVDLSGSKCIVINSYAQTANRQNWDAHVCIADTHTYGCQVDALQ